MSCAAELFVYGTGLSHWCCHVHEFNKWVVVQHSDVVRYFIVIAIFYSANTTAFHMSNWKFSEGGRWLNRVAKWVAAWRSWWKTTGLEVPRIFTRKMLVSQLNIRGVCRWHASIYLFWLRKILIVLFVSKQYQPFCVRTGGDALVKVPCSGLLPSFEAGLCYLRKWRRGESLFFILKQAQSM